MSDSIKIRVHKQPSCIHLSVADRITDGWHLQIASAKRYCSDEFLNFIPLPQPFRFAMKIECLKAVLPQIPSSTTVIMIDAMDVLFNNSLDSIVASYHEFVRRLGSDEFGRATSILCNGEKNCWPEASMASRYPAATLALPFPFLNSGVLIGPSGDILRCLNSFSWNEKTDDQRYWMQIYLESKVRAELPRIEVDHNGFLACCLHALPPKELHLQHGVAYIKSSGIRPGLLHLNGPIKRHIHQVAEKMGVAMEKLNQRAKGQPPAP